MKKEFIDRLKQLVSVSKQGDFIIVLDEEGLTEEKEAIGLINEIVSNYRFANEYEIMKYKLANDALGIALWDMDVVSEDPVNPKNVFTWSQELRQMLGFTDIKDFPNVLQSWSDRLHPKDKERTLTAFAEHLNDHSGKTPYNIEYRLSMKNGEYRYFHAFGTTLRDNAGVPVRVAGALEDIQEKKQMLETIKRRAVMVDALNSALEIFISYGEETIDKIMTNGIWPIANATGLDRVCIYRMNEIDENHRLGMTYLWDKSKGGSAPIEEKFAILPDNQVINNWLETLTKGININSRTCDMSKEEADTLNKLGVKSIFMLPVFTFGGFWGVITIEFHEKDFFYADDTIEAEILQLSSRLFAKTIIRADDKQSIEKMERDIKVLKKQAEKIYYDALTGIRNRRYFDETLAKLLKTLSRSDNMLSMMMIDIDRFKQYNDTYGHDKGDECLKTIAETLSKTITRESDFVVRYGGEEFIVVLPNTDRNGACIIAEKLLKNILECGITHRKSDVADCVTVSIGVMTGKIEHSQCISDYVKRADEMLYMSKQGGRNRYTFSYL